MHQRLPEHPCIQLRRCPHRGLPQRGVKETSDDRPGIRHSDGSDLPGNMFLKQHSVIDVVGALLMASVIYPIAYAPEAEKKKKYETSF